MPNLKTFQNLASRNSYEVTLLPQHRRACCTYCFCFYLGFYFQRRHWVTRYQLTTSFERLELVTIDGMVRSECETVPWGSWQLFSKVVAKSRRQTCGKNLDSLSTATVGRVHKWSGAKKVHMSVEKHEFRMIGDRFWMITQCWRTFDGA